LQHLRQHFNLLDDDSGDYSIEIDPREADWSTMGLLRELGFNRVSLGVQDLDPEVQAEHSDFDTTPRGGAS
jgi:oxygen-independent coproporphyrinogen-3 oxidase